MNERFERLTQVFRDVFDDDRLEISPRTSPRDIAAWDSISHVSLVLSVEKAFKVRFSSSEVAGLQNVSEILRLIEAKSGG